MPSRGSTSKLPKILQTFISIEIHSYERKKTITPLQSRASAVLAAVYPSLHPDAHCSCADGDRTFDICIREAPLISFDTFFSLLVLTVAFVNGRLDHCGLRLHEVDKGVSR